MRLFLALIIIILIFSTAFVSAIEVTPIDPGAQGQIASLQAEIKALQEKQSTILTNVNKKPDKSDIDTSFQQLDKSVKDSGASNLLSNVGLMVLVALLNDIILLGVYLIAKSKKVIP